MATILSKHVIFDLDGTLIDSRKAVEACYRHVFKTVLRRVFPPANIDPHIFYAMRPAEVFGLVTPDRVATCLEAYQRHYPEAAAMLILFDGARELIAAIIAADRIPSLVTNKGLARTLIDLDRAGIDVRAFRAIVTAEDTVERKPHPAPILLGLERAGARAADAVYVGDGPHDVISAQAAGTRAIAVTYGFYTATEMSVLGADCVVHDLPQLAQALGLNLEVVLS
ncbi:HAD family hydrolase [Acidisoma cladoniae]|jgi:phosphoglycolate phosphatase-like HAD superfamily hydrolase|uniref:HAD family hydrolase n=1 Tax=Acidisoma cladoniae TaxID=3040935 RepID=UPI00254A28EB|nr:HAD hydrolase-like protein [Acidisoma sp. PAMC 29798]